METPRTVPAAEQAAVQVVSNFFVLWTRYSSFSPITLPPHPVLKSRICREDSSWSAQNEKTAEHLFERLSARGYGGLRRLRNGT